MRTALWPRLATIALFVVLIASATHWALILFAPRSQPVPPLAPGSPSASIGTDISAAARLLGASATGVAAIANVALLGVIAQEGSGSAVLSVDGKPGQAFPVGREVAPGVVLHEVRATSVVLDRAGVMSEIAMVRPATPEYIRPAQPSAAMK
jgi:general secretion pathway protein C